MRVGRSGAGEGGGREDRDVVVGLGMIFLGGWFWRWYCSGGEGPSSAAGPALGRFLGVEVRGEASGQVYSVDGLVARGLVLVLQDVWLGGVAR